jgi:hypothetical protein
VEPAVTQNCVASVTKKQTKKINLGDFNSRHNSFLKVFQQIVILMTLLIFVDLMKNLLLMPLTPLPPDLQTFRRLCFLPEKAAAHSQIDPPLISAMYEAAIELIATNKLCVLYDGCLKLIIFYLHYCIYHAFFEKYKKVMPLQL